MERAKEKVKAFDWNMMKETE